MFSKLTCGGFGGKNATLSVIFFFLLAELMVVVFLSYYTLTLALWLNSCDVARAVAKEATVNSRELLSTGRSCGSFDLCVNPRCKYNAVLANGGTAGSKSVSQVCYIKQCNVNINNDKSASVVTSVQVRAKLAAQL